MGHHSTSPLPPLLPLHPPPPAAEALLLAKPGVPVLVVADPGVVWLAFTELAVLSFFGRAVVYYGSMGTRLRSQIEAVFSWDRLHATVDLHRERCGILVRACVLNWQTSVGRVRQQQKDSVRSSYALLQELSAFECSHRLCPNSCRNGIANQVSY